MVDEMESLPAISEITKLRLDELDDTLPPVRRQTITHTSEMYKKSARACALKHKKGLNLSGITGKALLLRNQRAMSLSL